MFVIPCSSLLQSRPNKKMAKRGWAIALLFRLLPVQAKSAVKEFAKMYTMIFKAIFSRRKITNLKMSWGKVTKMAP